MFSETSTFHVALGDGASFGKDDSACAWLISTLNIGQGVLSSNENFPNDMKMLSFLGENSVIVQHIFLLLLM